MSVGTFSLILLCAAMSSATTGSDLKSGEKRVTPQLRDTRGVKYNRRDGIQPAYSCGGNVGGLVERVRKALERMPDEWTHPWNTASCINNFTVHHLGTLDEDRPFLTFCKDGVSTVKFSLWSKFLRVLVRNDCFDQDSVTFRVASLRAEVDCFDYGIDDDTYYRPTLSANVKIREMSGLTIVHDGRPEEAVLKDRLFSAFRDLIEELFVELFEDAIRYNLRNIP